MNWTVGARNLCAVSCILKSCSLIFIQDNKALTNDLPIKAKQIGLCPLFCKLDSENCN